MEFKFTLMLSFPPETPDETPLHELAAFFPGSLRLPCFGSRELVEVLELLTLNFDYVYQRGRNVTTICCTI